MIGQGCLSQRPWAFCEATREDLVLGGKFPKSLGHLLDTGPQHVGTLRVGERRVRVHR